MAAWSAYAYALNEGKVKMLIEGVELRGCQRTTEFIEGLDLPPFLQKHIGGFTRR